MMVKNIAMFFSIVFLAIVPSLVSAVQYYDRKSPVRTVHARSAHAILLSFFLEGKKNLLILFTFGLNGKDTIHILFNRKNVKLSHREGCHNILARVRFTTGML